MVTVQARMLGWLRMRFSLTQLGFLGYFQESLHEATTENNSCPPFSYVCSLQLVLCVWSCISFCSWDFHQGSEGISEEGKIINRIVRSDEAGTRPNASWHSTVFDPWAVFDPWPMANWTRVSTLLNMFKYRKLTEISGSKVSEYFYKLGQNEPNEQWFC